MARASSIGFFPAPGTDYTSGQESLIAARLNRLAHALRIRLTGISGARSPAHSVAVGGFADDPHTLGEASDTPGIESVPEPTLRRFGLTRPFPGAQEADHIQLLGWKGGTSMPNPLRPNASGTLASLWTQAGGARNLAPIMQAIAMAESGGRTDAVGGPNQDGTYDYGPWQINSSHTQFDRARLLSDPLYNARAAVAIERSQGLTAWSTYTSGAFRGFLGGQGKVQLPGRTRPGGEADANPADSVFASYISEGDTPVTTNAGSGQDVLFGIPGTPSIPGPLNLIPGLKLPDFNPLDIFKGAENSVTDTISFMKWIAWIFHPRNILRIVEFLTGGTLMVMGIHAAMELHKDSDREPTVRRAARTAFAATPTGRAVRVARAGREGRTLARHEARTQEARKARSRGKSRERQRLQGKRVDREMGEVPF